MENEIPEGFSKIDVDNVLPTNCDCFRNLPVEYAFTTLNIYDNDELIAKIGDCIYKFAEDHLVVMYKANSEQTKLIKVYHNGVSAFHLRAIVDKLGVNPFAGEHILSESLKSLTFFKKQDENEDYINNFIFENIEHKDIEFIKDTLNFSNAYLLGLNFDSYIYGVVVILQTAGKEIENPELIESLVYQSLAVLDRNRFLDKVKESERKFATIFNETPIAEIIFDRAGNFVNINNAAKDLFGEPNLEHIRQMNINDSYLFAYDALSKIVPVSGERFRLHINSKSVINKYFIRNSSDEIILEATIKNYGEFGFLFQAKDETESIKILQELEENKENLLLIADNIPVMLAYIDSNLNYIFVNQKYAAWMQEKRDFIIGKNVMDIISPQMYDALIPKIQRVLNGDSFSFEFSTIHFGEKQILRISYVPHLSENGKVHSYFALLQDITEIKKNEEMIRESEQRYDAIFNRSYDCIYIHDLFGNFIDANDSTFKLLGYGKDEFLKLNFNSLLFPDQVRNAVRVTQEILITGAQKEIVEFVWKSKSNEKIIVEAIGSLIYKDGQPYAIQGVARDVTERKRIHEALKDSELRIRKIIENTHAGYFRINNEGYFEVVNSAWLQMHKYDSFEEIIGKHFTTTQVDYHINMARKLITDAMSGNTTSTGEFTRLCKDGSIAYHTYSLNPVVNNNEIVGVEGFIIDTTEQKNAQTDYKILFNSMLDGFGLHQIICDDEGKPIDYIFLDVNPAFEKITGLKSENLIGKSVLEVMPGTEKSWIEAYGKVALTGESINFENYSSELNRYFEITAFSPRKKQFGVIFSDITDRKRVESELQKAKEQAEESNRLNSIILGNLGHELRTPLNGALGFSQLLKLELQDPEQLEMISMVHQSMKRLEKTLNSLLTLTELEFGRLKLAICNQHISSILKMIYKSFEEMVSDKSLDFHLVLNDKTIYASIDETLINIIMFNLIDNALKFTNEGSLTIELNSVVENSKLFAEIKVIDTGLGIKKENLDKIFEPFRQESEGLNRVREGLGIGLTITQKMVDIMQGSIRMESQINKGTTVILRFPQIV